MTEWTTTFEGSAVEAMDAGLFRTDGWTVTAIDRTEGTITVMPEKFLTTFTDILKEAYEGSIGDEHFNARVMMPARAVPITPAVVVALATLGAFEWLRHRKAEVARAEATGDYSSILAEFVAWLRSLLAAWKAAA